MPQPRLIPIIILTITLITACGGGAGTFEPQPVEPPPPPPEPVLEIQFIDSIPLNEQGSVPGYQTAFELSHSTWSDADFAVEMSCSDLNVVSTRRSASDLADIEGNQLASHRLSCPQGLDAASHTITVKATRESGTRYEGTLDLDVGSDTPALNVIEEKQISLVMVDNLFAGYILEALTDQLDSPDEVKQLLLALIVDLISSEWRYLAKPDVIHDVTVQKVEYSSTHPDGSNGTLSGLLAIPHISSVEDFTPRDRIILLNHATGSTPSELDETDAWYILANLFAGHGFLVVAPDNFGRGTTGDLPETYLIANRTGAHSADLVRRVLDSNDYVDIHGDGRPVPISIIGYSQGGHSAIASWMEIHHHHKDSLQTVDVYSGGAPLDLYRTFLGVMQALDGRCNDDGYCTLVNQEAHVPYISGRILPGIIEYTDSGITIEDVEDDEKLSSQFIKGFLDNDATYDKLKAILQMSSFQNIVNLEEVFNDEDVTLHLYHSSYDRLVPVDNTKDFLSTLDGNVNAMHYEDLCDTSFYEQFFNATDEVGILHTLCGLSMLNHVLNEIR